MAPAVASPIRLNVRELGAPLRPQSVAGKRNTGPSWEVRSPVRRQRSSSCADLQSKSVSPHASPHASPIASPQNSIFGAAGASTLLSKGLSSPNSSIFGSPGRPSLFAESRSTKSTTTVALQLPPIKAKKQPLGFEDLYVLARSRVNKKSAQVRLGGLNPSVGGIHLNELPDLPKPAYRGIVASKSAKASFLSTGDAKLKEAGWAAVALASIPQQEDLSRQGSRTPAGSRTPTNLTSRVTDRAPARKSPRISHTLSEEEDKSLPYSNTARRTSAHSISVVPQRRQSDGSDLSEQKGPRKSVILNPADELPEILDRLRANDTEGFSSGELQRLQSGFNRFKVPGSADLHIDDVPDLLEYLGRVITGVDKVMPLLREVTSYDYIDFEEFVEFMHLFNVMEREGFQEVFDEFDTEESGQVPVQELRKMTAELGFMPLRKMIREALDIVDSDNNGQLNFDEFVTFLTVYRHAEGFTKEEVAELCVSFDMFCVRARDGEELLPPENLCDCLVKVFGLQVSEYAAEIGAKLANGQGLQKSSLATVEGGEPECLHFPELLIIARKIREDQFKSFKKDFKGAQKNLNQSFQRQATRDFLNIPSSRRNSNASRRNSIQKELSVMSVFNNEEQTEFAQADLDGDGKISVDELRQAMSKHGYTPLRQVMLEIFDEVLDGPWKPEYQLDFNEFFDFMLVLRHRDGFLRREVSDFKSIFEKFDDDNSGEISALELSDLMRFLGYTANLDDMHQLVAQCDRNDSGQLDLSEFLHLMRLYREEELRKIRQVYDSRVDRSVGSMQGRFLPQAMQELGYDGQELQALHGARLKELSNSDLDFDAVVAEMDQCRSAKVAKQRKKAGFSNEELEHFKHLFETFDKDKSNEIETMELIELLNFFNWQPRSKQAQSALMRKLDVARARCREAGIPDPTPDGSSHIRFWTFVQLARMLKRELEHEEDLKVTEVMQELKLTEQESEQFRGIFRGWIQRETEKATELGIQVPNYALKSEPVRQLVRSLGVVLTTRANDELMHKLDLLMEENVLTFPGFLRLMMWMVDTNFAGINDAAARLA